jgi:YHS domain-containing protein
VNVGEHRLRNLVEPVQLFDIHLEPFDRADAIDPVCRMRIDADNAAGSLVHAGRRFWFCSLSCAGAFSAHPDDYLPNVDDANHGEVGK